MPPIKRNSVEAETIDNPAHTSNEKEEREPLPPPRIHVPSVRMTKLPPKPDDAPELMNYKPAKPAPPSFLNKPQEETVSSTIQKVGQKVCFTILFIEIQS